VARSTGDKRVDAALRDLDPSRAELARAAVEFMTGGEGGVDTISLHRLANFLWYSLPVKWLTDIDEKLEVSRALGELFTRLDRPRYAALSDSEETRAVIVAYEQDTSSGKHAYRKAMANSGLEPPDVPGVVQWSPIMSGAEYEAFRATTVALERAIDEGELKPGAAGWRIKAGRVTERLLNSTRDDITGTTWLQWMHTDRLQMWVETGGATRRRLAAALADGLVHPVPAPADAADHIGPVLWLLDQASTGAPLTQNHYLARALVAEAVQRFGWNFGSNPRSEGDVVEAWAIRDLVQQLKWVRRSQRTLLLTPAGREVHKRGPAAVWEATMAVLLGDSDAGLAAGEVAAMLLLSDEPYTHSRLTGAVAQILAEGGWRDRATGEAIDSRSVSGLLDQLSRLLELLTLRHQPRWDEPVTLNEAGRSAVLTALRASALRPRTSVF
jgi:hypothetical protein